MYKGPRDGWKVTNKGKWYYIKPIPRDKTPALSKKQLAEYQAELDRTANAKRLLTF